MNRYREPEREIPIIHTVDVLVCGGGPAGVGAAVVAGRQGVSTMVVESMDCLGGTATAGLMSACAERNFDRRFLLSHLCCCNPCLGHMYEDFRPHLRSPPQ